MSITRARRDQGLTAALSALVLATTVSCASITVAAPTMPPGDDPGALSSTAPTQAPRPSRLPTAPSAETTPAATPLPTSPAARRTPVAAITPLPSIDAQALVAAPSSPVLEGSLVDPFDPQPVLDARLGRKLDKILQSTVRKGPVAGLSVAVMLPDGSLWTGTAGNAEYAPERPLTDSTSFAIASVTKTFIAALTLQLVDEGKLSLDAPYGTWLPEGPRAKSVTIRQLLSHRSGIHDFFDSERYRDAIYEGDRDHRWTYDEIMDLVKNAYCKPGECYRYSNTNYVLLGRIAEEVEGKALNRILRERFFRPLGLDDTLLQPDDSTPTDAAHGHWWYGGRFLDHTRDSRVVPFMAAASVANAAGAIVSTARDLAVWADALYGGDILSPSTRHEMLTFLPPDYYGLGARRASFAGHAAVGHRGGLRGFESSLWHFPQDDVSIVLLSNQGLWLTDVPVGKIAKAVFRSP